MRKTIILVALVSLSLPTWAQSPLKLGLLLDMSGPYADITGEGTVTAARMAVYDFGGKVLGRPIEIVFADHQNKPDIAASLARQWFDNEGVEAIFDVAASVPALAVNEIAKQRGKMLVVSGPGVLRLTNEECGPYTVHYAYDNYALAKGTGVATVKAGYEPGFSLLRTMSSAMISKGSHQASSKQMAATCWDRCVRRSTRLISHPSYSRRRPRGRRSSDSPMPAPTRSMRSSKLPSSASESPARSWRRCCCSSLTSIRWGSKRHKACC